MASALLVLFLPARLWVCSSTPFRPSSRPNTRFIVFETELMGIDGVPKPESIVTKSAEPTAKIAEKVVSVAAEAAEAVKTIIADTDDQEHNEL